MGYHLREIEKGEVGKLSKIFEEVEEIKDSSEQGVELMVLMELSDLVGAIEHFLSENHPSLTLKDLSLMASVTKRAFDSGRRG